MAPRRRFKDYEPAECHAVFTASNFADYSTSHCERSDDHAFWNVQIAENSALTIRVYFERYDLKVLVGFCYGRQKSWQMALELIHLQFATTRDVFCNLREGCTLVRVYYCWFCIAYPWCASVNGEWLFRVRVPLMVSLLLRDRIGSLIREVRSCSASAGMLHWGSTLSYPGDNMRSPSDSGGCLSRSMILPRRSRL